MCSFGYVVVNEKFDLVEKQEILINPEMPFKLSRDGFDPNVKLAHSREEFCSAPVFPLVYDCVAKQFSAPNRKFLGHGVFNDKRFLRIACFDYQKPCPDFIAYDTQEIYRRFAKEKDARSLEKIAVALNVDIAKMELHKSCDDAQISMLAVKAICEKKNCTIDELLREYYE
jgi:DNA polymerase III epsilon subunit-like protein